MKGAIDKRAQTKTSLMVEPCIIISCLWKEWNALIHPARQECIPGSARVQSPPRAAPSVSGIDLGQLGGVSVCACLACWFPPVRVVCPSRPVGPNPGPGRLRLRRSASRPASFGSGSVPVPVRMPAWRWVRRWRCSG